MRKGYKMSEKTKKQISNSLKGHKFSDNSIKKMSETIKRISNKTR